MFLFNLFKSHRQGLAVERRDRAYLEALQRRKFRALVEHCALSSPYYREIIAERGLDPANCRPEDFPELDKETLTDNFDRIATDPAVRWSRVAAFGTRGDDDETLLEGRYRVIHSSGSSGKFGYYVCTDAEWAQGVAPALRINPYLGRRRRLAFYGIINDRGAGAGMAMTSRRGLLKLAYDARAYDILKPVGETIAELDRFQPEILVGYPTSLSVLADAQRAGRLHIRPKYLQCSGEVVFPQHRQSIEEAFGRPLINVYSCSEHLILGMSPGAGEDMMLFEENAILEMKEDHTLVTNLFNYTLPLIRYRMNDRLVPGQAPAGDRRPYRRIKEIVGRSEGGDLVFRRLDGTEERITSFAFGSLTWKDAERIQFHVWPTSCRLDLVPEPGLPAARLAAALADARAKLDELFRSRGLGHIVASVRAVASIEPDPATGKVRAVVSGTGNGVAEPAFASQAA